MISVTTHLDIGRPAAEVFAFVSDQTNAPLWQQGLHEVRRLTDGPIGVGTEHAFVRRFAGRRIESRNRFTAYDEARRFVEFEIPDGALTGRASYAVAPTGEGRCRLTSRMDFTASGLMWLAEPLLTRLLRRDSEWDEATLKRLPRGTGRGSRMTRRSTRPWAPTRAPLWRSLLHPGRHTRHACLDRSAGLSRHESQRSK